MGAQPSQTVGNLLKKAMIMEGKAIGSNSKPKKPAADAAAAGDKKPAAAAK